MEDEHDCGITLCVQGQTEVIAVPTETPVPSSECMAGICMGTMPSEVPLGAGAECGVAGVCDGAGVCGECNFAVDCVALPPDDECQARTCLNNVCGQSFTASGTPLAAQVDGDCRTVVCNGSGGTAIQNDDADLIDDGNECTSQSCENGVALTENVVADTPCGTAEQTVCNGQGACVGCTMATQCGEPTFCGTPVCGSDQECGWEYTTSGTPLEDEDQVPGDCKRLQCSGTSEVPVTVTFGSDVPADDGEQCTVEACNGDAPVHLPAAANSACAQDGGLFCDGAGACVECLAESQCPPWTNDCAMPTCEMNACGFDYAPDGTALVDDVPGDCRRRECDGAGGIELEPFAMDPYDDGNECTADTCENGTPSNQAVADGTACTQNGGQVCMGGVCRRAAGSTCATAIECASGFCADGRCCESACTGNCVSCANPTGTCANVPVGEPDTCAAGSVCNAAGVCQEENGQTCTDGDECLSGNCVDGRCCESACTGDCVSCANPTGTCANVDAGEPDTCGAGSVCNAMGVCQEENGQTCTDGDECLSGNCVDGVCCESACTGDCVSCANPTGTCANVDAGEQDTCADGSACDGAGACQEVNGQACTGEDECLSGFCVDGVCCDSTCEGACQACDAPGAEGTCGDDPLAEGEPDTCGGVGEVCSDGACIEVFGVDCDGDEDCAGASCTDGVCCSSTCTEACHACDVVGYEGTCSPEPLLVGSQDSCPDPQVCNLEGACE
ncbi:Hypothetical protein CAP_8949 [Chondromyces apiculatus DSM 436]|uniref:Uncharacterized protein n=1 Tax=Chondromyces apiculatus DSM 436 TaxID=1192034 RepID=A0A017SW66_9BACT|nr:Hypothetical protein CAP_8949 [Chondromyces apiculatus DSM 436]